MLDLIVPSPRPRADCLSQFFPDSDGLFHDLVFFSLIHWFWPKPPPWSARDHSSDLAPKAPQFFGLFFHVWLVADLPLPGAGKKTVCFRGLPRVDPAYRVASVGCATASGTPDQPAFVCQPLPRPAPPPPRLFPLSIGSGNPVSTVVPNMGRPGTQCFAAAALQWREQAQRRLRD